MTNEALYSDLWVSHSGLTMAGLVHCFISSLVIGLCSASPAGREFATSFMQNFLDDGRFTNFLVEVAALPSSKGTTKVTVTVMGQTYENDINPGESNSFEIPNNAEIIGSIKSNQTVVIEASQDVTVMSLNFKQYTADTSVVYPVDQWGTEYYIFTPNSTVSANFKEFSITNYKEPNTVNIQLTASVTFQGINYLAGQTVTIQLAPYETAQFQSEENLTGTKVTSSVPVAVSSGHSCAEKYTSCNHVYEQLLPVNSWGREFIIAPLPYHKTRSTYYDTVSVQASEPTQVIANINGIVQTFSMVGGELLEMFSQWPYPIYLTSDKGVQVMFEFNGGPQDVPQYYDPFLMTILPTSYFSTSYALEGQGEFLNNIIVVAQNKDINDIKIVPKPKSVTFTWQNVEGTDYSWTVMNYSTGANFYEISHPESPFGLYSYGLSFANGYGSPAAADATAPPPCTQNSHYEFCGNACPATCANPNAATNCNKPCVNACVCDNGYVLDGTKCIPYTQCGCEFQGNHYKQGQSFMSTDCHLSCICNGTVHCQPNSCGPFEKCAVQNNVASCQPMKNATCTISGDPHYKSFNNKTFNFQGTCTYTVAQACHLLESELTYFSVAVENENWTMTEIENVAVAKVVAVNVYGYTLVLRRDLLQTVLVNGALNTIPVSLNEGKLQVFQEGFHYAIVADIGLKVTYDMVYKVTVTVSETYMEKICGLCGNYNFNVPGDFELPDGSLTIDTKIFGAAWKVTVPGVVCNDGCEGDQCPTCESDQEKLYEKDCGRLLDPNGSFAACHNQLSPQSYYNDCVYDVCMSKGNRMVLCHSITSYVTDCQTIGVQIGSWRSPDFCPIQCSENSRYDLCTGNCAYPCPGLINNIQCPNNCMEGCSCMEGYYFNGTGCVLLKDCGCYFNGYTLKIGESMLTDNCLQLCNCTSSGIQCKEITCRIDESCQLQQGFYGCHPKQCVIEKGSITLFSGVSGAISTGAYDILVACNESASDWFRVVAMLQKCTVTGVESVSSLYMYFNDLSLTVTDQLEAWVNGRQVTLPSLLANNVSVRLSDNTLVIEKKSVFTLYYSSNQEVVVTLSNGVGNNVCGACTKIIPVNFFSAVVDYPQETMQGYLSPFTAQDFPTC